MTMRTGKTNSPMTVGFTSVLPTTLVAVFTTALMVSLLRISPKPSARTTLAWVTPLIPSVMPLFLLSHLRHGYSTKSHACGMRQYQCLKMLAPENPLSVTNGMKQPPRGSSKVLSGSNNHPRRLYCCMERNQEGFRVCSRGRGRLESTK